MFATSHQNYSHYACEGKGTEWSPSVSYLQFTLRLGLGLGSVAHLFFHIYTTLMLKPMQIYRIGLLNGVIQITFMTKTAFFKHYANMIDR